jgi:hypothetical protein
MKLLTTLSFHYLVYVGMAILITTAKLATPSIPAKCEKVEEVKHDTASAKEGTHILHSELLFRY